MIRMYYLLLISHFLFINKKSRKFSTRCNSGLLPRRQVKAQDDAVLSGLIWNENEKHDLNSKV